MTTTIQEDRFTTRVGLPRRSDLQPAAGTHVDRLPFAVGAVVRPFGCVSRSPADASPSAAAGWEGIAPRWSTARSRKCAVFLGASVPGATWCWCSRTAHGWSCAPCPGSVRCEAYILERIKAVLLPKASSKPPLPPKDSRPDPGISATASPLLHTGITFHHHAERHRDRVHLRQSAAANP